MTLRTLTPVALAATVGLVMAGAVPALAQSDDSKPTIDGSGDMGVSPSDVAGLGKDNSEVAAPPPPAPRVVPAPVAPPRRAEPAPIPAPAPNFFAGNPYVWGAFGWIFGEDSDVTGGITGEADVGQTWALGAAAGWHFDNGLRTEIEAGYFDVDIDNFAGTQADGAIEVVSGMLNVIYELPMTRFIHPYAGAGVGIASVNVRIASPGNSAGEDTVMAWQFIGGTSVEVTQNLALTFDYRYFETDDVDFIGNETEFSAHKVMAGVRYTFDMK